jgi:N-formylglutamate amidohydrolase
MTEDHKPPAIVLHIPHASTEIPSDVRESFVIDGAQLELELLRMTDHFTDELFALPADSASSVAYPVSRLVCDPERYPDDSEETMSALGMGVIYTQRHDLGPLRTRPTPSEREALLDRYYRPHHEALEDTVSAALAAHNQCLVIDCHSFPGTPLPYETDSARPDICIGTDEFHTPHALRDAAVSAFESAGLEVAVDRPFAGALTPASRYKKDHRVSAVMIEVNRRLYMDEEAGERGPEFNDIKALIGRIITSNLSNTMRD